MHRSPFFRNYPLAELIIFRGNRQIKVNVIIDTGSPYTIIPSNSAEGLNFKPGDEHAEIDIIGIVQKKECIAAAPAYGVGLRIGHIVIPQTDVLVYDFDSPFGILGHNVLSKTRLLVDWKERMVKID